MVSPMPAMGDRPTFILPPPPPPVIVVRLSRSLAVIALFLTGVYIGMGIGSRQDYYLNQNVFPPAFVLYIALPFYLAALLLWMREGSRRMMVVGPGTAR